MSHLDGQDPLERFSSTIARARDALGPELRSLILFGSCLSSHTCRGTSIPDLVAIVDDVDRALVMLGTGALTRWAARILPPITLSFRSSEGAPLAKLNLVDPRTLRDELDRLRDLYLAGRLSKRVAVAYRRDAACDEELSSLLRHAAESIVGVALLARPRHDALEAAIFRCVSVSYEAEPRPERAAKIVALFDAFAPHYRRQFGPLVEETARARGIAVVDGALYDGRDHATRADEGRRLASLLRRSWWRMIARWPKQALVYRGWLPYLVGKIRRARLAA
jgi:hypothetical protein